MLEPVLLAAYQVVLWVGALASIGVGVLYPVMVPKRTMMGNHLLVFSWIMFWLCADQLTVLYIDGYRESVAHALVILLYLAGIAAAMVHRLALLIYYQVDFRWKERARPGDKHPEDIENTNPTN